MQFRRRLPLLATALLATLPLLGGAQGPGARPNEPGATAKLRVLTEDDLPGPSRAKVTELLRRAGIDSTEEVLPWARAFRRAQVEPETCLYSTTRTAEREPLFAWIAPLRTTRWVLIGRKDDPRGRALRDLDGARSLVIGGYRDDAVVQFLQAQGHRVELVDTNVQSLRMLLAGRVDLWATSASILRNPTTDPELVDRVATVLTLREVRVYLACSPKTSPQTQDRLRRAWAQMEADGSAARLEAQFDRP